MVAAAHSNMDPTMNVDVIKQRIRQAVDQKREKLEKGKHREKLTKSIHQLKLHLSLLDNEQTFAAPTAEEQRIERIKRRFRHIKKMQKEQRRNDSSVFTCLIPSCGAVGE